MPYSNNEGVSLSREASGVVKQKIASSPQLFEGVNITVTESYNYKLLPKENAELLQDLTRPTKDFIDSREFRTIHGNQMVGNSYTISRVAGERNSSNGGTADKCEVYVIEMALVEAPFRTRIRYVYTNGKNPSIPDEEEDIYDLSLLGFTIMKEIQTTIGNDDNDLEKLYKSDFYRSKDLGETLYDPQESGVPYAMLPMPGTCSCYLVLFRFIQTCK